MCFSATASLVSAGVIGAIGVVTLRSARSPKELPVAAIPMMFAVQQAAEGGLWLSLESGNAGIWPWLLSQLFLAFALVIWPVYAPVAAILVEPEPGRRKVMQACGLAGVFVASFFLVQLVTLRHEGFISDGHVIYRTDVEYPVLTGLVYSCATVLALLVSSHRALALLGAIIGVGALVTYVFMAEVFVSVWCFFAAASSFVILAHFQRQAVRAVWG